MSERETSSGSDGGWLAPLAVLVTLVGAAVALALAGWKAEAIIGFLSGLAGLAGTALVLLKINVKQTETLSRIDKSVNGELDRRIKAGAKLAAEEALRAVLPPSNGRPGPPPPRGGKRS